MSEKQAYPFKGVLRSKTLGNGKYSFRLYPWKFSNDPMAEEICEILFESSELESGQISKFEGNEIDVEFTDTKMSVYNWDLGNEYEFSAASIRQRMVPYELKDFVDRITGLEAAWQEEHGAYFKAKRKLDHIAKVAQELIRRAEIKASSSDDRAEKHHEAIKVLKRVLAELESSD